MRRFLDLRDPLFLAGSAAYALSRGLIKPALGMGFPSRFNDCWLISCALPSVLGLHRRLGLRSHDKTPQISEITLPEETTK